MHTSILIDEESVIVSNPLPDAYYYYYYVTKNIILIKSRNM